MGEEADYIVDCLLNEAWNNGRRRYSSFKYREDPYIWKTKEYGWMSMWDMDVSHLKNCISLCRRRGTLDPIPQLEFVLSKKQKEKSN